MGALQQALLALGGSSQDIKLLLHGDGVDGATSTQDSSAVIKTVAMLGSSTLSNAQSKFGFATSISCPGGVSAQNGVRVSASGDFNFGTGDFTIDCWVSKTSTANEGTIFQCGSIDLRVTTGANVLKLNWVDTGGTVQYIGSNSQPPVGEFFHVALARRGRSVEVWMNGFVVIKAERASAYALNFSSDIYIGCASSAGDMSLGGYISEFCITKGYATPTYPQMPIGDADPHWASVVLAMTGAQFIDRSSYAKAITVVGSPTVELAAGLGYDNHYFKGAAASYFKALLGVEGSLTGDFTIEMLLGGSGSNAVFGTAIGGYLYNFEFSSAGGVSVLCYQPSSANERAHVAISRVGSDIRTFYNGRLVATVVNSSTVNVEDIRFGYYVPNNNLYCLGVYDDIRITKGVGRYTTTFTRGNTPTAPYTLTPVVDPWKAVFNFEGDAVGAQGCIDSSVYKYKADTFGPNMAVSDVRAKFGTKSLLRKGTSQGGLFVGPHPGLNYATTDEWTIGMWVYLDVWVIATMQLFTITSLNVVGGGWAGISGASGAIHTTWNFGAGGSPSGVLTVPQGVWTYIEFSHRADAMIDVYIDGVFDTSFNSGVGVGGNTEPARLHVGGYHGYTNGTDDGSRTYIDGAFYCKGRLHTAAFTPPTTPPPF